MKSLDTLIFDNRFARLGGHPAAPLLDAVRLSRPLFGPFGERRGFDIVTFSRRRCIDLDRPRRMLRQGGHHVKRPAFSGSSARPTSVRFSSSIAPRIRRAVRFTFTGRAIDPASGGGAVAAASTADKSSAATMPSGTLM